MGTGVSTQRVGLQGARLTLYTPRSPWGQRRCRARLPRWPLARCAAGVQARMSMDARSGLHQRCWGIVAACGAVPAGHLTL